MSTPLDLQARIGALFARMATRGLTEAILVFGKQTQLDGSGAPVARATSQIGIITAYVAAGGGFTQPAQEGVRTMETHQFGFLPVDDEILSEANYPQRWLQFPARDDTIYRIALLQQVGPYLWGLAEKGSTVDIAGGTK